METKHKIKTYKGVDLYYIENNGRISFEFEGIDREVKYIFEAENIIDEPKWETCSLQGYFVDGYIDKYIGTAIATRKNIKNGEPDWKTKGEYDLDYKETSSTPTVYLRTPERDQVYKKWKKQRETYQEELRKLNNIASSIKDKEVNQ